MNHELLEAQRKARDKFLRFSTVIGVGVGPKVAGGQVTSRDAIVVLVTKKLPRKDVPKGELVPRMFDGYPTDVREPVLQIKPTKGSRTSPPPGDWCRTDAQWIDWVKIHQLNVAQQRERRPPTKKRRPRGTSND
jgi:hypothetical protein